MSQLPPFYIVIAALIACNERLLHGYSRLRSHHRQFPPDFSYAYIDEDHHLTNPASRTRGPRCFLRSKNAGDGNVRRTLRHGYYVGGRGRRGRRGERGMAGGGCAKPTLLNTHDSRCGCWLPTVVCRSIARDANNYPVIETRPHRPANRIPSACPWSRAETRVHARASVWIIKFKYRQASSHTTLRRTDVRCAHRRKNFGPEVNIVQPDELYARAQSYARESKYLV